MLIISGPKRNVQNAVSLLCLFCSKFVVTSNSLQNRNCLLAGMTEDIHHFLPVIMRYFVHTVVAVLLWLWHSKLFEMPVLFSLHDFAAIKQNFRTWILCTVHPLSMSSKFQDPSNTQNCKYIMAFSVHKYRQ